MTENNEQLLAERDEGEIEQEYIIETERPAQNSDPVNENLYDTRNDPVNENHEEQHREKEKPVKRIGTFTMGLSLIYTGVLILCSALIPDFNIATALKFMPAILILLGAELLASCFWGKERKVKYDILGSIISLVLICGSLTASVAANAYQYYYVERTAEEVRIRNEENEKYSEKLAKTGLVADFDINASIYQSRWDVYKYASEEEKKNISQINFNLILWNGHESKEDFAEDCYKVIKAIGKLDKNASIYFRQEDGRFTLNLYSFTQQSLDKDDMARLVEDNEQVREDNV